MRLLAFVIVALWLSGCAQTRKASSPPITLWRVENLVGASAASVALRAQDGTIHHHLATARVKHLLRIARRVETAAGEVRPHWVIATGEKANAFATYQKEQPLIAVNVALLDLLGDDADELAAVLGHELAHLYEGHGRLRRARKDNLTAASQVAGLALGLLGVPGGGYLTGFAANALDSAYSRDEERDADRIGMRFAWQAGYHPLGAVRVQEKLERISTAHWIPLMNTHPPSAERTQTVRDIAVALMREGGTP